MSLGCAVHSRGSSQPLRASEPAMNAAKFCVNVGILPALVEHVQEHGHHGVETGAFVLSSGPAPAAGEVLALTGDLGIVRRSRYLEISDRAIDNLFRWSVAQALVVRAHIHSHSAEAFMSWTDERGGFNVEGFVSGVVPDFGRPPSDPSQWGWWSYGSGNWTPCELSVIDNSCARVVVFDAGGVREL